MAWDISPSNFLAADQADLRRFLSEAICISLHQKIFALGKDKELQKNLNGFALNRFALV
jgi:hypothetical protein